MPLEKDVEQVRSLMHTLATQDVIDNTYGLIMSVRGGLHRILADLSAETAQRAGADVLARLRELAVGIEERPSLFGIPEKWLINDVLSTAKTIRMRLDALSSGPAAHG